MKTRFNLIALALALSVLTSALPAVAQEVDNTAFHGTFSRYGLLGGCDLTGSTVTIGGDTSMMGSQSYFYVPANANEATLEFTSPNRNESEIYTVEVVGNKIYIAIITTGHIGRGESSALAVELTYSIDFNTVTWTGLQWRKDSNVCHGDYTAVMVRRSRDFNDQQY